LDYQVDGLLLVLLSLNVQLDIDWKAKKLSFHFGGKQKSN
jgi:hypothetical protein